jgi:phosphonate transport system substrate-binding protein
MRKILLFIFATLISVPVKRSLLVGVALSLTWGAGCKASSYQDQEATAVRITSIPDENPTELQRKVQPMVDFLQESLGIPVKYIPVTDYGAAVQALVAGRIDFAWLGGFTYVQSRNMAEVSPLCMRDIDREFKSVFIANVGSGVHKMDDLRGKKFAFGSKSSTSGHMMPRHFLSREFKIDSARDFDGEPVFSGAHDATAKIVESGKVAAGTLNAEVWKRMVAAGKIDTARVKVIWTTPAYVDYVWTARNTVSEVLRNKFRAAFLALDPSNPEHKKVLALQGAQKFVAASAGDFDAIEEVARSVGMLK